MAAVEIFGFAEGAETTLGAFLGGFATSCVAVARKKLTEEIENVFERTS